MSKKIIINIICLFLPAMLLANCTNGNIPEAYKPTGIRVNPVSLDMKTGDRVQVKASILPAVANQPDYLWVSDNTAVATVDNGLVEAVSAGKTTVKVSALGVSASIEVKVEAPGAPVRATMYEKTFDSATTVSELSLNGMGQLTADGLKITSTGNIVQLNKFYALAERMVQYRVVFTSDTRAVFRSSQGDFNAYVDVPNREISIATSPVIKKTVDFLQPGREYLVEIYHIYQEAKVRIVDSATGEEAEISAVHDGQGGVGQGALQPGFSVGMQWDHYCFGLAAGSSMTVKQMTDRLRHEEQGEASDLR